MRDGFTPSGLSRESPRPAAGGGAAWPLSWLPVPLFQVGSAIRQSRRLPGRGLVGRKPAASRTAAAESCVTLTSRACPDAIQWHFQKFDQDQRVTGTLAG